MTQEDQEPPLPWRCAVVGRGRMGNALVTALGLADRPRGRSFDGAGHDVVILAVPDKEIAAAASALVDGPVVGHCSGMLGLEVLFPHEAFSMHPLMTVRATGTSFTGAAAAVEGSSVRARDVAHELARRLGMKPVVVELEHRAAYHAAAAIASNYLLTLEDAAETLMRTTGHGRELLVPLVRATVENWARFGAGEALTGPVARGDEATVEHQRRAVADRCPQFLELFDTLTASTRALAGRRDRLPPVGNG